MSFNRGMAMLDTSSFEDLTPAYQHLLQAAELEPNNAQVIAGLALFEMNCGILLSGKSSNNRVDSYAKSIDLAKQAYSLDRHDPFVNLVLGKSYHRVEQFEQSREAFQRALNVIPGHPELVGAMGNLLAFMGVFDKAISLLTRSQVSRKCYTAALARTYLQAKNYEKACEWSIRGVEASPGNSFARIVYASALGHLGNNYEAISTLQECEKIQPGRINDEFLVKPTQYKDPREQDHILDGVLKAGWQV